MQKKIPENRSSVANAAEALRKIAATSENGALIGSEETLLKRLGVSRPTFRQAAALVSREQLIFVKRGVKGGYFASHPDSLAVSRVATVYLRSRGTRLAEIIEALAPIREELSRLAAQNCAGRDNAALGQFLSRERDVSKDDGVDYRSFLRAEREFGALIGQLADNSALQLFLEILYDLIGQVRNDVYVGHADRIRKYRDYRNRLAEAILDGDEDLAALASHRCSQLVMQWLLVDTDGETRLTGLSEAL